MNYITDIEKTIKTGKEREYFNIHQIRYQYILERVSSLNLQGKGTALDIGCFPPHIFNRLKKGPFSFAMHGISSNHERVKQKSIISLNIEKDKLPYKDSYFDLILMTELIEHLTVNPLVYLAEVKRVLKPKGILLITTPNAAHLKNRSKLLLGRSPSFSLNQLYETGNHDGSIYHRHNREFTMSELKHILKRAGLTTRQARYVSFYTPFRKGKHSALRLGGHIITNFVPPPRDSIYVEALAKKLK